MPEHDSDWEAAVARCLRIELLYSPVINPDQTVPSEELSKLSDYVICNNDDDQAFMALKALVEEGSIESREVPIRLIQGVSISRSPHRFNLNKLPEQMTLSKDTDLGPEGFGPLYRSQMQSLWDSLHKQDCGIFDGDGRINLDFQSWDNCYVASIKYGGSHRLALWLRLQSREQTTTTLQAVVKTFNLNQKSLDHMDQCERLVFLHHSVEVQEAIRGLATFDSSIRYFPPSSNKRPAMIVLPQAHRVSTVRMPTLLALHRWVNVLFDLGRYLRERSTTYNHRFRP